jgi:ATP phosphoribosyltransferase
VHGLASFLREHGAEAVSVAALDYVYTRENPLYERLVAELDRSTRQQDGRLSTV